MERRCENCEFYYQPKQRCVRFPPHVFFRRSDPGNDYEREFACSFPWVPEPGWCGEFKAVSAPAAGGE